MPIHRLRRIVRRRSAWVAMVLSLALVATLFTGVASAPADAACTDPPAVVPEDELVPGTMGTGLTALDGTNPVSFQYRIVGTIPDGWMLGIDAIVIEITGPASFLARPGGVFFGMSGSPAYVNGALAGAVSAVFYDDAHFGVLTPAESMLGLLDSPSGAATAAADVARKIPLTAPIRREIAGDLGVVTSEVTGSFQQLPVLVGAAGLPPAGVAQLQQTLDDHGENMRVYSAGTAPIGGPVRDLPFAPGEPLGAAISYGDATLFATGTATFTCGNEVAAFGHPFFYDAPGDISLGLAGANGLMVLGGRFFPGSRFATLTEPRGQIVQDQFVGILGVVGQTPPSTPITSDLTNLDSGFERQGTTEAFHTMGYWLEELVWFHLYLNIAAVLGHFGPGTTDLHWTIDGTREDGTPFTVQNREIVSSSYDASEVIYTLMSQLDYLEYSGFETVGVTGVSTSGETTADRLEGQITSVKLASPLSRRLEERRSVPANPGDRVTVQVTLDPYEPGDDIVTTLTVKVPRGARGSQRMRLSSGTGWWPDHRIRSFDDLLEALNGGTHYDQLVLTGFKDVVEREPVVVIGRSKFTIDVVL
jgi:SpoIVB peptidase S55